jgi:hypothetical protein
MAITYVSASHAKSSSTSSSSVSATWAQTTTAGNTLFILVTASNNSDFSINTPANFTLADAGAYTAASAYVHTALFYRENAPASSGSQSVSFSSTTIGACIQLAEYSGLATSSSLDKHANNNGNGTTPDSGTTATTTQPSELWIAALGIASSSTFSSAANGFTIEDSITAGTAPSLAFLDKIVSSTGTADAGATASSTGHWAGAIGTFQAASSTFPFSAYKRKRRLGRFRRKRPGPAWLTDTKVWNESLYLRKKKRRAAPPRRRRRPLPPWITDTKVWSEALWLWFKKRKAKKERPGLFKKAKKAKHQIQLFPPWFPHKVRAGLAKRRPKKGYNYYAAFTKPPANLLPGPFNAMWATALIQETNSATALVQESYSAKATLIYPP